MPPLYLSSISEDFNTAINAVRTAVSTVKTTSGGRGWEEIEALLAARASVDETGLEQVDQRLMRAIELAELTGCPARLVWQWQIARELFLTPTELEKRLERLDRLRGLRWDERLGTVVFRL